jgi:hypothetical protein
MKTIILKIIIKGLTEDNEERDSLPSGTFGNGEPDCPTNSYQIQVQNKTMLPSNEKRVQVWSSAKVTCLFLQSGGEFLVSACLAYKTKVLQQKVSKGKL